MTAFLHDLPDDDPYCRVCGERYCTCDESDFMPEAADDWDDWSDEPRERVECKYCGGDGMLDDITPCPHCDGEGYEWWLP